MAEEGQVITVHTVDEWNQRLQKANETKKLMVVDFTASWCGPCKTIAPFFSELARRYPNVIFLKVDVDELNSVAADWAVEAMPTFVFVRGETILEKVVGAKKDGLQQTLAKLTASSS